MSLDPMDRQSWRGVTEALRPPQGFELHAAVLTTYGLAFDAVLAALLAFEDVDAADLSVDTLSKVIAATTLANRVQILVQRGTVSGKTLGLPSRLAGLLDGAIVPLAIVKGVFHPKLWVVCFRPCGTKADAQLDPTELLSRVVVSSRNLSDSTCLEMGVMFESTTAREGHDLGVQVAQALRSCDRLAAGRASKLVRMVAGVMEQTRFKATAESANSARVLWQDERAPSVASSVPQRNKRLIVVSPFLADHTVRNALTRSEDTLIISSPGALAKLRPETMGAVDTRAIEQKHPVLYAFRDDGTERTDNDEEGDEGDEDELGRLDGLHAKVILVEPIDGLPVTLVGSANATTRGWGAFDVRNVECMIELTPGIPMKTFLRDFVYEKQGHAKNWLTEFRSDQLQTETVEDRERDELARCVQAIAALEFTLVYDGAARTLVLRCAAAASTMSSDLAYGFVVECAPLGTLEETADTVQSIAWRPFDALASGSLCYDEVDIAAVSAFVAVRVRTESLSWNVRIAQGDVTYLNSDREARDQAARNELLASTSASDILAKLILGLKYVPRPSSIGEKTNRSVLANAADGRASGEVTLERVLQAIAINPRLIDELHLLLSGRTDPEFTRFMADIRSVLST